MLVKVVLIVTVFFFKQKTAYEMRISDWSSDVCSSDLTGAGWISGADPGLYCRARVVHSSRSARGACMDIAELLAFSVKNKASDLHLSAGLPPMIRVDGDVRRIRSEEHTSELQSLMRISSAVFCLKKKKRRIEQREY